jgi:hypothetical protein
VALAAAAVAAAAVLSPLAWRVLRHVVTIAHEGGHLAAALATGRRLGGVRLHSDTSGLTLSSGRPRGPGMVLTAFAGYVAPSLLGLVLALVVSSGRTTASLWAVTGLLAALLLQVRNAFGVLSVVVTGAALVVVGRYGDADVKAAVAHALAWFLLLAGPRAVLELQRSRRRGRARMSDADQLARLTGLPGLVWVGIFLGVTLAALVAGGARLLVVTR